MKTAWLVGLVIVCAGRSALAEEANVGAVGNVGATPAPAAAPPPIGGAERFAAPNGQLGAGLTSSPQQKLRVFGELGFSRAAAYEDAPGASASVHQTGLSFLLGGGYKLTDNLELQAMVPFAWGESGYSIEGPGGSLSGSDAGIALANLHLGVSYFSFRGPLRFMAGGALEYGPWTNDPSAETGTALYMALGGMGGEWVGLWAPETFSIVAPARIEYAFPTLPRLSIALDGLLGLHISTGGGDTNLSLQLSPGVGYYATETVLVGLRMPLTFVPTESGSDTTFVALQPYGRFDLGPGFLDASFMLNLDDPYGFSFDQMKVWALRIGGGASF